MPDTNDDNLELLGRVEDLIRSLQNGGAANTKTKDEVMFLLLDQILRSIRLINKRLCFLEKYRPHLQVLAWLSLGIGTALLALLFELATGKASLIFLK